MRKLIKLISKAVKPQIISKEVKYPFVFSYGKYVQENPVRIKKERIEAIKKFLDHTR